MRSEDEGQAYWIAWHVLGLPVGEWERTLERALGDYVGRLRAEHPRMGADEVEARTRSLVARVFDLVEELAEHDERTGGTA